MLSGNRGSANDARWSIAVTAIIPLAGFTSQSRVFRNELEGDVLLKVFANRAGSAISFSWLIGIRLPSVLSMPPR